MWEFIDVLMLLAGIALAVCAMCGVFKRRKLMGTFIFIGLTFVLNFALYLVPYIYSRTVMGAEGMAVYDVWECLSSAVRHFVGEVSTANIKAFAADFPLFTVTFSVGTVLAMAAMISTALLFFKVKIRNHFRLVSSLGKNSCDIVVGTGTAALSYARNNKNVVVMADLGSNSDAQTELMEEGYTVFDGNFSRKLLEGNYFNSSTRYNFIFIEQTEKVVDYINTFISFKDSSSENRNIYLYIETDESSIGVMRREVLERNKYRRFITLFSRNELLAMNLTEKHPVTECLPQDFFDEDTSVKPDKKINVVILGFGELNREVYKQFVMNNQFVTYSNGEYVTFPLNYYIYDENIDSDMWSIDGVKNSLEKLKANRELYFPLPELPCNTCCIRENPTSRTALEKIAGIIGEENSYTYVIIDVGDVYKNIEIMSGIRFMTGSDKNYKIILKCESGVMEGISDGICYGDIDSIFTHEVIVNESLSVIARKINEIYVKMGIDVLEDNPNYNDIVKEKSENSWNESSYFNIYSNIYSALNLRLKLHLIGLDYKADGKGQNPGLIKEKYTFGIKCKKIEEYFSKSKRNAMLAQEHIRWNTYHLMSEWNPLEKDKITVSNPDALPPKFTTKDTGRKRHACLTTYSGLGELSAYLARSASTDGKYTPMNYDYCSNDEMLILSAGDILKETGFSVTEK